MDTRKNIGIAGSVAGLALAAGGAAFAAFLSHRHKGGSDDAPLYTVLLIKVLGGAVST